MKLSGLCLLILASLSPSICHASVPNYESKTPVAGWIASVSAQSGADSNSQRQDQPAPQGKLPRPVIVVSLEEIEDELSIGDVAQHTFNIANESNEPLTFRIRDEIIEEPGGRDNAVRSLHSAGEAPAVPRRDRAGDVIAQFNGINNANEQCSCVGWDWDNHRMWVTNMTQGIAVAYTHDENYHEFREVIRTAVGVMMDGCWADGYLFLWISPESDVLGRFDAQGRSIGGIRFPFPVFGVAADVDNELLFVLSGNDRHIYVFRLNGQGDVNANDPIGSISNFGQYLHNDAIRNIEWVSVHPHGQLWLGDFMDGRAYQIEVDTSDWTCTGVVQSFPIYAGNWQDTFSSIAHDEHNLWVSGIPEDNIRIYDDGIEENYWLSYSPEEGVIEAEQNSDVTVTLNGVGLVRGNYVADLHIFSDDPDNPQVDVRISLGVVGTPRVESLPVAFPFEGAQPVDLGAGFLREASSLPVRLKNPGTDDLVVNDIAVENEEYFETDLEADIHVQPQDSIDFNLIFHPLEVGEHQGRITIFTNAFNIGENDDRGTIWYEVRGSGKTHAHALFDPDSAIAIEMANNHAPVVRTLTIGNDGSEGAEPLVWSISPREILGERDRLADRFQSGAANDGPLRDRRGQPDQAGYEWRDSDENDGPGYRWIDISNREGVQSWQMGNDNGIQVQIGFNFPFYGGNSNQIWICSNGWISLSQPRYHWQHTFSGRAELPASWANNDLLAAAFSYWQQPDGSNIMFWSDDRVAVVTFNHLVHHGGDAEWTFQIVLDSKGMAKFQYQDAQEGHPESGYLIGYQNDAHNIGAEIYRGNSYIHSEFAITIGPHEANWIPWLSVNPLQGTCQIGDSNNVVLTLYSDDLAPDSDYRAVLLVESNDPNDPAHEIDILLHIPPPEPVHFAEYDPEIHPDGWRLTDANQNILVTDLISAGEAVPSGWEIGVFTPQGVLSGGGVWRTGDSLTITAWGAEDGVEQFSDGDLMTFRLWDNVHDCEYEATASVSAGDIHWSTNQQTILSLSSVLPTPCRIAFTAGWNLISINIRPTAAGLWLRQEGPDIRRMTAQFREGDAMHLRLMRSGSGEFYAPEIGDFCNIPFWNLTEGYWLQVDSEWEGVWDGSPIPPDADLPLTAGWNLVAYYPTYPLECSSPNFQALTTILDHVIIAKDNAGHFAVPRQEFSNMEPWQAGQAYAVNVDADLVLHYPAQQRRAGRTGFQTCLPGNGLEYRPPDHWPEPIHTGSNMSLLLSLDCGMQNAESAEIVAFAKEGLCVGHSKFIPLNSKFQIGLAVWGDDPTTDRIDGLQEGEAFTLKGWSFADEKEFGLKVSTVDTICGVKFKSGATQSSLPGLTYKTDALAIAHCQVSSPVSRNILPTVAFLGQNHPNPFNSVTRFAYGLPEAGRVAIRVFDSGGRLIRSLIDVEQTAGYYSVAWNTEPCAAGVYLIRLETANFTATKKALLIK